MTEAWTYVLLGACAVGALAVVCYGIEPLKWYRESKQAESVTGVVADVDHGYREDDGEDD